MIPEALHIGEETIPVSVIAADSRIVEYTIKDDLTLELKIPLGMDQEMAAQFLKVNRNNIYTDYCKKKVRNHQALPTVMDLHGGKLRYYNGQTLPYLGEMNTRLSIKYVKKGDDTKVYATKHPDGSRTLTIQTDNPDQNFIRYCVIRYYKKCAGDIIKNLVYEFGEKMDLTFKTVTITSQNRPPVISIPGFSSRNIEFRDQKTLWSSCSRRSNLRFDWKLLMLPLEVIEYIIVHELTHLKKAGHSDAFWAEMERILPEYRECRRWLDKHGKEYEIF